MSCSTCFRDTGRIFGQWANCSHGWAGRLAEVEFEAASLRELLSEHVAPPRAVGKMGLSGNLKVDERDRA